MAGAEGKKGARQGKAAAKYFLNISTVILVAMDEKTDGTLPQGTARESLVPITIVLGCHGLRRTLTWRRHAQKLAAMLQLVLAVTIAEEPVVTNAVKSIR